MCHVAGGAIPRCVPLTSRDGGALSAGQNRP